MARANRNCELTGLVVGKFSPLHAGHEFLIKTAAANCDKLIILSYSSPEYLGCCAETRRLWLSRLFPAALIVVLDSAECIMLDESASLGMRLPGNSMDAVTHREFCARVLSKVVKKQVDVVFSSEEYGAGFAEYLNKFQFNKYSSDARPVRHFCVDLMRQQVPVSGSQLREGDLAGSDFLSANIAHDYAIESVCFIGAESTAKSTLTRMLADQYRTLAVAEYGRELWQEKKGVLTSSDLLVIAKRQIKREVNLTAKANRYIFCDTSPLTTLLYHQSMFDQRPAYLEALASREYRHVFLCYPDFPLVQDGTRGDEEFRQWQHQWYLTELQHREICYTSLHGSLNDKYSTVLKQLGS